MRTLNRGASRAPAAAGTFYPEDTDALHEVVKSLFDVASRLERDAPGRVRAVVIPHAGYTYSGVVAAVSLAAVKEVPGRVILMGPAHRLAFKGVSGGDFSSYEIPGGSMPVDREALADLEREGLTTFFPDAHRDEHSLEVIVPLLLERFGSIPVVPLLLGTALDEDVAEILNHVLQDDDLLVVSSDLSHYLTDERCRQKDATTLEHIVAGRPGVVGPYEACGHLGIAALNVLRAQRGWTSTVLGYSNSSDSGGDKKRVVGYGALVFTET